MLGGWWMGGCPSACALRGQIKCVPTSSNLSWQQYGHSEISREKNRILCDMQHLGWMHLSNVDIIYVQISCVLLDSIFNIHLHIIIKGQTDICQQDDEQNIIFTQASHIKCKVASSLDTGSVWRLYWVRLLHIDLGLSVTILTFFTMMDSFQHLPAASLRVWARCHVYNV